MTPKDLLENSNFKGWFIKTHGPWPGTKGEEWETIWLRVINAQAEYIDQKIRELHAAI